MDLLDKGHRVINIDETWLNETSFIRKNWAPKNNKGTLALHPI